MTRTAGFSPRGDPDRGLKPAVLSAFTLIEILVVITIFMILMGLTIGSVVRGPKLQRMVAAEQVVADCIRQARHTARTSGQPVVLKLKKDERSISGLVRTVLWHGVEGPASAVAWPQTEWEKSIGVWERVDAPGRTGLGLELPGAYQENGVLKPERAEWDPDGDLAGTKRLWRGAAIADPKNRPGLLLSVAVRPPIAGSAFAGQPAPTVLPLALVAQPGSDIAAHAQAHLGLALVLSTVATDGPQTTRSAQKVVPTWEVIGWFGAGGICEVSSISNPPKDFAVTKLVDNKAKTIVEVDNGATGVTKYDEFTESNALVGGRWTEIALLVEGDRLVLYRDGRRIGENTGALAASVPFNQAERVYVGICTLKAGVQPQVATGASLDEVRIERLGDALAGTLPSGVTPDTADEQRIICHPDGRVEVDQNTGDDSSTIIRLISDSGERAEITVDTSGAVASRVPPESLQ